MKEIEITRGHKTMVDDEDYEFLNKFYWQCYLSMRGRNYVQGVVDGKQIKMHRFIMGVTDPKIHVDHIDGNPFNNQKSNLRLCTNQQNTWNQGLAKNNTSGYKGVWKRKRNEKWEAAVRTRGICYWLGDFDTPEEAARAYDRKALELFGEFARLNFPIDKI